MLWSTGVSTWEPLNTFFQDTSQDVADYAWKHNLLGNVHWKHVQDYVLNPPKPTTITDFDNKTELIDGTILNHDSTIIDPMDQTAAAAKAANATRSFQRLVVSMVKRVTSSLWIVKVACGVSPSVVTSLLLSTSLRSGLPHMVPLPPTNMYVLMVEKNWVTALLFMTCFVKLVMR